VPINPPRETPRTEKVANRVAATGRTYVHLIAVLVAIVGTFLGVQQDPSIRLLGIALTGLAGGLALLR
jgi:LytS/YehU family sensor histidine kinase